MDLGFSLKNGHVFLNKVFLKFSNTHLFTFYLRLL